MKKLHEVIADTKTSITEIMTDGKKLWKIITSTGEVLIGEIGYKVFNSDWTCRTMRYEVGKKFEEDVIPSLCDRGLHYCPNAADCFKYYDFDSNNKVALVLAYGMIDKGGDKHCTNKLYIIREIPWSELLEIANEGKDNTGLRNTGNCNTGDCNTGDRNTGDCNTGNCNTGDRNTGNCNTGNCNFGNRCTGDFNIADDATGVFCTEKQTIKIFDVDSGMTLNEWRNTDAAHILSRIPAAIDSEWIYPYKMSEEEKKEYPDYEARNGYLKLIGNEERFIDWWKGLTWHERNVIRSIPNFDAVKFKLITGIDVNHPGAHTSCYHLPDTFNVGDKVVIRHDLDQRDRVPFSVNQRMTNFAGRDATIISVRHKDEDRTRINYKIDIDDGKWNWSCLMFEGCGFCR